ncbi:MAG TPA: trehalose-6-phosphate synthase, partial [Microthrixaceae bacterium]|nr:trehalose-6-phosphate synthase [Microthrixaceae bacterium]
MVDEQVVIVSNRGPASFVVSEDGQLEARRGSGGLVSGLASLGHSASWFAAAISDGDRVAAGRGVVQTEGFDLHLLSVDEARYHHAYDVIANETLWFLHHDLWALSREPRFDDRWREAWQDYREVNRQFADAVAAHCDDRAIVLVQDYHLSLLGSMLAERRPDLRTVHFHHTPFCTADEISVLPEAVAAELLDGLCGFRACGFHTHRWAMNFAGCSAAASLTPTFVAPLGIDPERLVRDAHSPETDAELARIEDEVGGRRFLVRVDRIELSKNLLRGFDAFETLLERDPSWRGQVTFGAFCYPSREGVPAYAAYREDIEKRVAEINSRWGGEGWTPILFETDDNYSRSLAALRRADAVLVNPVR